MLLIYFRFFSELSEILFQKRCLVRSWGKDQSTTEPKNWNDTIIWGELPLSHKMTVNFRILLCSVHVLLCLWIFVPIFLGLSLF